MQQDLNSLPTATPLGSLPLGEVEAQGALYLQNLGMRVREARAKRGMSRRVLSRDSRVSERYLAQLESGQGNISILLLRQISQALDLPMAELLYDGVQQSSELKRAKDFLEKLPAEKLQRARELLAREFLSADPAARRQRIALVGLRGAGKSTLGHLLAKHLAVPFIELDRVIEQRSGLGLSVIFDLYGQSGFRRLERECLDQVLHQYPKFVLATGGSLVSESATYERLLAECLTIWLRATPEEHMQRVIAQGDTRPMSEDREAAMSELKSILAVREPLYRRADATIDTSRKSEEATLEELRRTFAAMSASPANSVVAEEQSVK
jgi:XRE family transcriptional regulator, aerobic/anaerobic benzoate catabolism transcriptional regulator